MAKRRTCRGCGRKAKGHPGPTGRNCRVVRELEAARGYTTSSAAAVTANMEFVVVDEIGHPEEAIATRLTRQRPPVAYEELDDAVSVIPPSLDSRGAGECDFVNNFATLGLGDIRPVQAIPAVYNVEGAPSDPPTTSPAKLQHQVGTTKFVYPSCPPTVERGSGGPPSLDHFPRVSFAPRVSQRDWDQPPPSPCDFNGQAPFIYPPFSSVNMSAAERPIPPGSRAAGYSRYPGSSLFVPPDIRSFPAQPPPPCSLL